jgi:hypothetical protein
MSLSIARKGITLYILAQITACFDLDSECSKEGGGLKWITEPKDLTSLSSNVDLKNLFDESLIGVEQGDDPRIRMVSIVSKENNSSQSKRTSFSIRIAIKSEELGKELEILRKLTDSGAVPELYACTLANSGDVYILEELFTRRLQYTGVIAAIKQKSPKEALKFWGTGFDALKKIHERGFVHNDINSMSMMTDDDFKKIVFIKWEVAQSIGETNNNFGTPLFMNFLRRSQTNCNPVNDLYMFALSIVVFYSNHDFVFSNVPQNKFEIKEMTDDCFKSPKGDHFFNFNLKGYENLKEFCRFVLQANTISVMRNVFGQRENEESNSVKMNFSSLISQIIDFERSKSEPKDILRSLENVMINSDHYENESVFKLSEYAVKFLKELEKLRSLVFENKINLKDLDAEKAEKAKKDIKERLEAYFKIETNYLKKSHFLQKYKILNKRIGKSANLLQTLNRFTTPRNSNLNNVRNEIMGRTSRKDQSLSEHLTTPSRINLFNMRQNSGHISQRPQHRFNGQTLTLSKRENEKETAIVFNPLLNSSRLESKYFSLPLNWNDELFWSIVPQKPVNEGSRVNSQNFKSRTIRVDSPRKRGPSKTNITLEGVGKRSSIHSRPELPFGQNKMTNFPSISKDLKIKQFSNLDYLPEKQHRRLDSHLMKLKKVAKGPFADTSITLI